MTDTVPGRGLGCLPFCGGDLHEVGCPNLLPEVEARGRSPHVMVSKDHLRALEESRLKAIERAERAEAERDRHGKCICNTGPGTDGPEEFCPRHGRTYGDLLEMDDAHLERAEKAEAVVEKVTDSLIEAQEALKRVLELHQQDTTILEEGTWCPACGDDVPCRTVRAIGGPLE